MGAGLFLRPAAGGLDGGGPVVGVGKQPGNGVAVAGVVVELHAQEGAEGGAAEKALGMRDVDDVFEGPVTQTMMISAVFKAA